LVKLIFWLCAGKNTMKTYNEFCRKKQCNWYIEWEYTDGYSDQPYLCISCKLIGQSHDIIEYPNNCPFINKIKQVKLDT